MRWTRADTEQYRALRRKEVRAERGEFLLEGWRALAAAIVAEAPIVEVVVSAAEADRPELATLRDRGITLRSASARDLERISATEQSQGVVARVHIIPHTLDEVFASPGLVLALDAVADPGNLGTIVRTADWFGAAGVILGHGCVDPFNDKVTRATVGSLFHVPIVPDVDLPAALAQAKSSGLTVVLAASTGGVPVAEWSPPPRCVLVLGSEAHGVSPAVAALADATVSIPSAGRAESLNVAVAAGILMARAGC